MATLEFRVLGEQVKAFFAGECLTLRKNHQLIFLIWRCKMMSVKKRSWMMIGDTVYCFKSSDNLCKVATLRKAKLSVFHDKALMKATEQINAILVDVEKSNESPDRNLAFLDTDDGLLLAWAKCGGDGAREPEAKRALNLFPVKALK